MNQDKLCICVRDDFPDYMVPTLVAHAVLRHHAVFCGFERYDNWLLESFKKCVVRVNRKEFDKIRSLPDVGEAWENTTLNGELSCLTIVAHTQEHNVLKFAKLWKPKDVQ